MICNVTCKYLVCKIYLFIWSSNRPLHYFAAILNPMSVSKIDCISYIKIKIKNSFLRTAYTVGCLDFETIVQAYGTTSYLH